MGSALTLTVASLVVAAAVGLLIVAGATEFERVVVRVEVGALVMFAVGVAFGSERLVAAATAPTLVAVVFAAGGGGEVAWGQAVVTGCLWYVAVELALASIEQRDSTVRSVAVMNRRAREVATVVAIGAAVGMAGLGVASLAPERTLLIRMAVALVVLSVITAGLRHLDRT